MTKNTSTIDHLAELSRVRDSMHAELERLDQLILLLSIDIADTKRNLAKFELGEKLGATKLSRLLGCSRNHAIKHLETTFAEHVSTQSNGYRWVPRSVVEAWLLQGKVAPPQPSTRPEADGSGRSFKCDRCLARSVALVLVGDERSTGALEFCGHHLAQVTSQLAERQYEVVVHD